MGRGAGAKNYYTHTERASLFIITMMKHQAEMAKSEALPAK